MVQEQGLAAPPTLIRINEPRIGIVGQGGGLLGTIFGLSVYEQFARRPDVINNLTILDGTSSGAGVNGIVKSALAQGNPGLITKIGRSFTDRIIDCMNNPFSTGHVSVSSDFFAAARAQPLDLMYATRATPLFTLGRYLRDAIGPEEYLVSGQGPALQCSATRLDPSKYSQRHNHALTYEQYTGHQMSVDKMVRSAALEDFGHFQGYNDGAYGFRNGDVAGLAKNHDLTDIIVVALYPYDPTLPIAAQDKLRHTIRASEKGLMTRQIHSEALLMEDEMAGRKNGPKIHLIHNRLDFGGKMENLMAIRPHQVPQITQHAAQQTVSALADIVPNLGRGTGKTSTYAASLIPASNLPELVA